MEGDVAKKTDTERHVHGGGSGRRGPPALPQGAISYTGPMFGAKMPKAKGPALEMEQAALAAEGVDQELFAKARLPGGRRWGRITPDDLEISPPRPRAFGSASPCPRARMPPVCCVSS